MTLDELIEDHRAMYRADLYISQLVTRQPPSSMDVRTGERNQEPGAATGMAMAGRFLRYLSHPEGYGYDFPWSKALWKLRVECRRNHPQHRSGDRPFWRGSLCHQAVRLTVIGGEAGRIGPLSASNAARVLRLDHIESMLRRAFGDIETTMDDYRERAEKRVREDEGLAPPVGVAMRAPERHDMGGMHRADCPQCRRRIA